LQQAEGLLAQAQTVDGVSVVAARISASSVESLREMGDWLRDKLRSGIVVLGGVFDDRPSLVVMVTPDLVAKGYKAGDIAKAVAYLRGRGIWVDPGGGGSIDHDRAEVV
jgi:alanyl-tRNA synthetase